MEKVDFRVGFVGVGRMGANMARRLKDQGFTITAIYDIDSKKATSLASELSCKAVTSLTGIAECSNTVITVVTDDQAMRSLFNEKAADSLLALEKDCLFINCATLSPKIHHEIESMTERHGGQSLEACMASSITQAREGTLYLMCAGKLGAFDRAKPLLESLSESVRFIGPAGEAAKVKALVNMVMNINTAGLAEGLGLGEALGLDLDMLREVFAQTGAASRVLETDGSDMVSREHECYFSVEHARKDCNIALKLAQSKGISLPLAKATLAQYKKLVKLGKGDLDKSAISELTFRGRS
ncbi:MAG: NAD(P)-dependent oxidoreductase [Nitrospirales bacterium]|nr:NAD(P)-dependent oxidoreductase [Nitrospirales bacterium]